jgi:hypothetical protein
VNTGVWFRSSCGNIRIIKSKYQSIIFLIEPRSKCDVNMDTALCHSDPSGMRQLKVKALSSLYVIALTVIRV